MTADELLAADDGTFLAAWRVMRDEERAALPEAERARCYERFRKHTKYVEASSRRAERSQKKNKPKVEIDFAGRFVLIYPTDTAFDREYGELVKIANMRLSFGKRAVDDWLSSPDRRTVELRNVVFDPAGQADPHTTVNLFRGLCALGAGGECTRLLELLQFLCGEAGQDQTPITDWVLKWMAYPRQNLGAKMQTAIVMHGPHEGPGKNLLWNAVREGYGEYGSTITQVELESPYNGWISRRLFLIANEVVSRHELRHHVGRLKNLVTERETPISEKYLPLRHEVNHCNIVFLTNELHALQISPGDRRYQVIRTPPAREQKFYQAVVDEIAAGGVDALHRYLLELDVGDCNEHTKPIMTQAKEDLIDIGLSSPQQFWKELQEGLLAPLPYCPCLSSDLYVAYRTWCDRNGVKAPRQSNFFSHEFMAQNGVSRRQERVRDPEKAAEVHLTARDVPQRIVFRMGARSEAESDGVWVRGGVRRFREALREYEREGGFRRYSRSAQAAAPGE